jgi:hypothetical protein
MRPLEKEGRLKILRVIIAIVVVSLVVYRAYLRSHPSSKGPQNVRVGQPIDGPDEGPRLELKLSNVRTNQRLLDVPPFTTSGGDFTVFDATLSKYPGTTTVTIAVQTSSSKTKSPIPIAWGKAAIWAADRATGERAVQAFAKAFKQSVPVPKSPQPLKPMKLGTVVLGENLGDDAGPYTGSGSGSWSGTKWFLEDSGYEAEVFFNYDLKHLVAEFSEKDSDYDADMIALLAQGLRDGPRPPRTPQTDLNLALTGPSIAPMLVPDTKHCSFAFTRDDHLIVYQTIFRNSSAYVMDPANPLSAKKQIAAMEGSIEGVHPVTPDGSRLVLVESMPKDEHVWSSGDPKKLWLIEGNLQKREIQGAWGNDPLLGEHAISPDGKLLAVTYWIGKGKARKEMVTFYELRGIGMHDVEIPDHMQLDEWIGDGPNLRAVLRTSPWAVKDAGYKAVMLNPITGDKTPMPETAAPETSPDGKHQLVVTPNVQLDVIDASTKVKQSFVFHEDDRRLCDQDVASWLSPRYIALALPRQPMIDITTMKMSYLTGPDEKSHYHFSDDLKWAAAAGEDGIKISAVKIP